MKSHDMAWNAALFRVPHVRLRREEEDAIQRGMSALRELPKARSVEIFPRPVRIAPARFRRPVTAAEALGHLKEAPPPRSPSDEQRRREQHRRFREKKASPSPSPPPP